jgi:hypothetical protein
VRRPLLAAAALAALAGCGREPARAVLGEWRGATGRMIFYPDGQLLMQAGDSAAAASEARYEFAGKRVVRIRSLAAAPADYGVRVTRDSLVLCSRARPAECFRMARVEGK